MFVFSNLEYILNKNNNILHTNTYENCDFIYKSIIYIWTFEKLKYIIMHS